MRVTISQQNEPLPDPDEVAAGLVALAGGQSGALALPSRVNIVATAVPGTAVRVQVVGSRMWQTVHNRTGTGDDLVVYPPDGHQFENYGANVAVAVPDWGGATYIWDGDETWIVG